MTYRTDQPPHRCQRFLTGLLALAVSACVADSDSDFDSDSNPGVADYLGELPTWDDFAPRLETLEAAPSGPTVPLPDEDVDVTTYADDGSVTVTPDVPHRCVTTPYSIRDTPERVVTYSPDREILWPGALIQGTSHRDGLGSLLGLPIAERAPIRISIPSLPSGENYRELDSPNQATASAVIGEMIGDATLANLVTPSDLTFDMRSYASEKEFALSIGLSGRYLGFTGSASGDFSRAASETTVTAHFVQKMYEVVVEPPATPDAFFTSELTRARLDEQIDLGRIGPDNVPVYVSNVVYGRMMTFAFTSSASEREIRATIEAAYQAVAGEISGQLTAKQRSILDEAKIAVTSLGGDAQASLALIRSGDWREYFTADAPLSSAAPLSYTLRHLDGTIAAVTETAEYDVKECAPALSPEALCENLCARSDLCFGPSSSCLDTCLNQADTCGEPELIELDGCLDVAECNEFSECISQVPCSS